MKADLPRLVDCRLKDDQGVCVGLAAIQIKPSGRTPQIVRKTQPDLLGGSQIATLAAHIRSRRARKENKGQSTTSAFAVARPGKTQQHSSSEIDSL